MALTLAAKEMTGCAEGITTRLGITTGPLRAGNPLRAGKSIWEDVFAVGAGSGEDIEAVDRFLNRSE
jgi:hypothetical protein